MKEGCLLMEYNGAHYASMLVDLASDILLSPEMQREQNFIQHGSTTCYAHSANVACMALYLADVLHLRVDRLSLARGALLHDFFLYDWHESDPSHRLHGFRHPFSALKNARKHFDLNPIECDAICKHMFPLTPFPPLYKESLLVCLADKLCALDETLFSRRRAPAKVRAGR